MPPIDGAELGLRCFLLDTSQGIRHARNTYGLCQRASQQFGLVETTLREPVFVERHRNDSSHILQDLARSKLDKETC